MFMGAMIAHIYGRNIMLSANKAEYEYEYYEVKSQKVQRGHVEHCRQDGIIPLISLILTKVKEENEKK